MAHISAISAGLYSNIGVHFGTSATTDIALPASPNVYTSWDNYFETADNNAVGAAKYAVIGDVREFPSIGTPPNIVKVPVYGQATSKSIQAQSDAPQLELTINYVPSLWASGTLLGDSVGDGVVHAFRFCLLDADPGTKLGSAGVDMMLVKNTQYFWLGKVEALLVKPSLTDATTATLTLSIQSDFFGAFTTP